MLQSDKKSGWVFVCTTTTTRSRRRREKIIIKRVFRIFSVSFQIVHNINETGINDIFAGNARTSFYAPFVRLFYTIVLYITHYANGTR